MALFQNGKCVQCVKSGGGCRDDEECCEGLSCSNSINKLELQGKCL